MEALLSANTDILIPPLSLTVGAGASYIQNRRSATIFSSQVSCSPAGVQVAKWNIASSTEFCDPGSVIISFDVNNLDQHKALYPATSGAHCLFERYQCRIASTGVEDQEHFGRLVEGFTRLMPTEKKLNESALGFGTQQQVYTSADAAVPGNRRLVEKSLWKSGDHVPKPIPANGTKKVFMKLPLSGVFGGSQSKYLPLWALGAGGIEVSLSLAPANQAVITQPTDHATGVQGAAGSGSTNYALTNLRIECDMVSIDSNLQEQYSRNMLEGGALTLHTKLWNATQVYLPENTGSFDVSVSKSLSRVATCFQTFSEELTAAQQATGTMYVNNFRMYPSAAETCESHMTVGSKRFPEYENKSISAHFWKLTSALGVAKSLPHSLSTDVESYARNSFCVGTDLEACPLVMSSGINTTGGQELAFHARGFVGADPTTAVDVLRRCWMLIHYEAIVEIRATGCHLLT